MYTNHFGLTKKPFSLTPDPHFLYLSSQHKKALIRLQYALASEAEFTVISGEIGAGKTTLIRQVINHIANNTQLGLITNTHATFGDLLIWILVAFKIKEKGQDKAQRYQLLVDFLQQLHNKHRHAILIIDEAQNMDLHALEELRLLSNINSGSDIRLQIVLVGQPELMEKLKSPKLVQFAQRISIQFHLTALSYEQTEHYIHHRLKIAGSETDIFTNSACVAVYHVTHGIPRLINNICDLSLVFAFANGEKQVTLQTVMDVLKEKKANGVIMIQS